MTAAGRDTPEIELARLTRDGLELHLPALRTIDEDTLGEPWGVAQWRYEVPEKWRLSRLLLLGGVPVGFVVASRKGDAAHIHRIAVAREHRGRRLAERLVSAVVDGGRDLGCSALTLFVHRDNAAALRLYERLGFRAEPGADELTIAMRRPLDVIPVVPQPPRTP